jgi:hypothetical protein
LATGSRHLRNVGEKRFRNGDTAFKRFHLGNLEEAIGNAIENAKTAILHVRAFRRYLLARKEREERIQLEYNTWHGISNTEELL